MTEPAPSDDDDLDFFDTSPMTLKDWIEILEDDLDQAVDELNGDEIEKLCAFLQQKIDTLMPF